MIPITNYQNNKILLLTIAVLVVLVYGCSSRERKPSYHPEAVDLNNRAVEFLNQFDNDSALVLLEKAIEADSTYYVAYWNKCGVHLRKKQFDKALHACNKTLELKPDLAQAWVTAGILNEMQGNTLQAMKYYGKSIELFEKKIGDPGEKEHLAANRLNYALSLMLLGRETEGKQEISQLKAKDPDNKVLNEYLKYTRQEFLNNFLQPEQ